MNKLLEKYTAQIESKSLARGIELGKAEGVALGKAEGVALGKSEGIALGKSEGIANTLKAISLVQAGKYAIEEIASLSGLSVDEVKALQAELSAKA